MTRILIVEDDYLYADWLKDTIETSLNCEVEVISSEAMFRTRFEFFEINRPDLIIMDVMLRWSDAANDMTPPPSDLGTFHRAGLRCLKLLRCDSRSRDLPAILYSVLDENDIAHDIRELNLTARHIVKSIHPEAVLGCIQSMLAANKR